MYSSSKPENLFIVASCLVLLIFSRSHSILAFNCYYLGSRAALDQTIQAFLPALPYPIFHPRLVRWPTLTLGAAETTQNNNINWVPITSPGRQDTLQCAPNQLPPTSLDTADAQRNVIPQYMCYSAFGTFGAELALAEPSSSSSSNDVARLARFKPGEFFSSFGCVDAKLKSDLIGLFGSADVLNTHHVFTDGCHVLRRPGTQFNGTTTKTTYTFDDLKRFNAAAQVPPELLPTTSTLRMELGTSAWGERNATLARGGVEAVFCFCSSSELCNDQIALEVRVKQNFLDRAADVAIAEAIRNAAANTIPNYAPPVLQQQQNMGVAVAAGEAIIIFNGRQSRDVVDAQQPPVYILSENIDTSSESDYSSPNFDDVGRTGRSLLVGSQQSGRFVKCHRQFLRLPQPAVRYGEMDWPTLEKYSGVGGLNQISRTRAGDCPLDTEYCFYFQAEQPAYPWLNFAASSARNNNQTTTSFYYDGILVNNFDPNRRYADARETFLWRGCLAPEIRSQLQTRYGFDILNNATTQDADQSQRADLRYDLPRLMFGHVERCFEFSMSAGQVRGKFCACRTKYCAGGQSPPNLSQYNKPYFADSSPPSSVPSYNSNSNFYNNDKNNYGGGGGYLRPVIAYKFLTSDPTTTPLTLVDTNRPIATPQYYNDDRRQNQFVNDDAGTSSSGRRASVVGFNSDEEEKRFVANRRRARDSPGDDRVTTPSITTTTTTFDVVPPVLVYNNTGLQQQPAQTTTTFQNLTLRWWPAPNGANVVNRFDMLFFVLFAQSFILLEYSL